MSKKLVLTAALSFCAVIGSLKAEIWTTQNIWTSEMESKYTNWFASTALRPDMFTAKNSPYYGIKADCADAAYAFRAIFSLENGLPFKIVNPLGASSGKRYIDNESNFFDKSGNKYQRLVAMVNYLGDVVGTEHLSMHDTYPVKISSVKPGTLYTYKILGADGNFIRHAYNIKNVTKYGDFDLIYATQTVAKENLNLVYKQSRMVTNAPMINNWGFKRFKWPDFHDVENANLHPYFQYSTEQYDITKKIGERPFFKHVTEVLRTSEESSESLVERRLKTACLESSERILYVNQGYNFSRSVGGRCLDYAEYDAYSTPSRDKNLLSTFLDLKDAVDAANLEKKKKLFKSDTLKMAEAVIYGDKENSSAISKLKKYCAIWYKPGSPIHLAELYKRVKNGQLTYHPNDSLDARWGDQNAPKTSCKKWY